jgi:hypothetical protein
VIVALWLTVQLMRFSHALVLLWLAVLCLDALLNLDWSIWPIGVLAVIAASLRLGHTLGRLGMPT